MRPTARAERFVELDLLRGLALYGVLIVNLVTLFRVPLAAHVLGWDVPPDRPGQIVYHFISYALEFKAFTLFSFLFGVGIGSQAERAAGDAAGFLIRRFLVLLGIGMAHLLLIWNGDILTLYSLCGVLLVPLLEFPAALLAGTGAALILINYYVPLPDPLPNATAMAAIAAASQKAYLGSFSEVLRFRLVETAGLIAPLNLLVMARTLGLMLLGMAAWKGRIFGERNRGLWYAALFAGAAAGIAGMVAGQGVASVPLALAYAAALLLWTPRWKPVAAAGQMALTNYLAQSVAFGFVFYGYGLGLMGKVGETKAVLGGTAFYVVQLAFSRWWLRRYHFGPAEWLWRSLTYGRRQPFRITASGS